MIKNFIEKNNYEYLENANLKLYNTYRFEVIAKYLVFPRDIEEFVSLLKALAVSGEKYLVLGNGSNVILKMAYYDGVIIHLSHFNQLKIDDDVVYVGAGYSLQKLALETCQLGLLGLEFATGIPGAVGASIAMNAGAYQCDLGSTVLSVTVVNPKYEVVTMRGEDLEFSYRDSFFKKNSFYYVVAATLKLQHGDKLAIMEKVSKRRVKRIETQPLNFPSAGSVFRNPEGMYAGELIEKAGLKGYVLNGAMISDKHANFIVNVGGATGEDVVRLIDKVEGEVKDKFGVELVLEQIIVD